MQTHEDSDARQTFIDRLRERAKQCVNDCASEITIGKPDEKPLAVWKHDGIYVTHMPDDEQGILRISIGGGSEIVSLDYCTIRGGVGKCIDLMERAIAALRKAP